jgi:ABC-2 type transport system permease protein
MCSIGVVSMPVHLTGYRERGVLRRFRASSVSAWSIFGSQVVVGLVTVVICAVLLTIVAIITKGAKLPEQPLLFIPAFLAGVLCFSALGVFLGALFPTTRAAQGIGLLLFFIMMILGGAGPPPEVLTGAMTVIGDATPLRYVILTLQDPWLGFGWDTASFLIVCGITIAATLLSVRLFRWE